jgi:hypothetical protein
VRFHELKVIAWALTQTFILDLKAVARREAVWNPPSGLWRILPPPLIPNFLYRPFIAQYLAGLYTVALTRNPKKAPERRFANITTHQPIYPYLHHCTKTHNLLTSFFFVATKPTRHALLAGIDTKHTNFSFADMKAAHLEANGDMS